MYIRYELFFDGIPQDIGFMNGLGEIELSYDENEELMDVFEKELPLVPQSAYKDSCSAFYPACYFTEQGIRKFDKNIERLIDAIHNKQCNWTVNKITLSNVSSEDILYQDDYQAVIKTPYASNELTA